MAKRFTDTNKWKKRWFKGLSTVHKLFFMYLCDNCDHAGIWNVELDIAEMRIGESIGNEDEILEAMGERIHVFGGGHKWFILPFVEFQYNNLNPAVNAHKSVISLLKNENLIHVYEQFMNSSLTVMDKDKDKDMDKDKDKDSIPDKSYPQIEEVKSIGFKIGLSDEESENYFHNRNRSGWVTGLGQPIANIQSDMIAWRNNQHKHQDKTKPKGDIFDDISQKEKLKRETLRRWENDCGDFIRNNSIEEISQNKKFMEKLKNPKFNEWACGIKRELNEL